MRKKKLKEPSGIEPEIELALREIANSKLMYFESAQDYKNRPSWDEIFMNEAYEASTRSSCLYLKTGAVVVKNKRIKASGYNGAAPDTVNCLDRGCRKKSLGIEFNEKGTGTCRGNHAEKNAMRQLARDDLIGATLYTVFFPCSGCARDIAGNGIAEVVYDIMYSEPDSLTSELFSEVGIKLRQLTPNIPNQFIRKMRVFNQRYSKELYE